MSVFPFQKEVAGLQRKHVRALEGHALDLKPHEHNYFEMYYLVSGKVIYHTCGSQFLLRPNDVLFINQHQQHHPVLIDPEVPYERILFHVPRRRCAPSPPRTPI